MGCSNSMESTSKNKKNINPNIEKAKSLINTFSTGDINLITSLLKDSYIQHNLSFETGKKAFIEAVKALNKAPIKTTVKNIRSFQDKDKVILHSIYNFAGAGEQVAFDIFKFENGLISEHWDNISNLTPPNISGHTQIDGETNIVENKNTEISREIGKNFIYDILHGKAPEKITNYFDGDNYIQHNSNIGDGLSGLGNALKQLEENGIKMIYEKTHMILASGDFVLGVSEGTFGGKKTTYYDLFRIENKKIAEHWDVMEELLPQEQWKNNNGKF